MAKRIRENLLLAIDSVLSAEDIEEIDEFANHVKLSMPQNFESRIFADDPKKGGNNVIYMNQVFKETLPHIYSTIIEVANRKLIQSDWHPQIKGSLGVRCVERLEYNTGFFLDWHEDTGSIYTLILFLSQHGADYEGGEFNIWSADSEAVPYIGNLGSALIFRSECSHSVTPISKGTRTVLVLEFWEFQDTPRNELRPSTEYGVPFAAG